MKKLFSTMLAAVMISSCMVVPAFAYPSDIPSVGQQEYAEDGIYKGLKANSFNTDARVYPTSQAPALKNTKTINGVTFSQYIKHQESDITLENGERIHLVRVYVGVDGAMHSSASDARFVFHSGGFILPARMGHVDNTVTTGELSNTTPAHGFKDLQYHNIKPFADNKGTGGEYVGNLTWQFLKDEDRWALYEEELTYDYNGGYASYSKTYDIAAFVNGVQTNFIVIVTTDGTPKGDNTSITTSTIPAVKLPSKNTHAFLGGYKIFAGGNRMPSSIYVIEDYTYIKLRDLAFILNGTEKQFNVGWDNANKAVSITTGQAYTGKAAEFAKEHYVKTFLTESPIYVDGVKADFTVYNIGGNNYFKLRDLAKYFDFYLHAAADELTIDATKKYQ